MDWSVQNWQPRWRNTAHNTRALSRLTDVEEEFVLPATDCYCDIGKISGSRLVFHWRRSNVKTCLSLGNDSAPAMSGIRQGFRAKSKGNWSTGGDNHASMKLSEKMDIVKREDIQVVNCNTVRLSNRILNQMCSDTRQVMGSTPNGVNGIFQWHNPSGLTMALGSTQPLTDMSTRCISWG